MSENKKILSFFFVLFFYPEDTPTNRTNFAMVEHSFSSAARKELKVANYGLISKKNTLNIKC